MFKRLTYIILFWPVSFLSLIQVIGFILMWVITGEDKLDKETLLDKLTNWL